MALLNPVDRMLDRVSPLGGQDGACVLLWAPSSRQAPAPAFPSDDPAAAFLAARETNARFLGAGKGRLEFAEAPCASPARPRKPGSLEATIVRPSPDHGTKALDPGTVAPAFLEGRTFLYAMLHHVDPSISLLSHADVTKVVGAFVERVAQTIRQDPGAVAAKFAPFTSSGGASKRSVVQSLADPRAALADGALNDAVVLLLSDLIGAAIVVLSSQRVSLFPPDAEDAAPTLLVKWSDAGFVSFPVQTLRKVRARLWVEAGYGADHFSARALDRLTYARLQETADAAAVRLASGTPKKKLTKAEAVDKLARSWN